MERPVEKQHVEALQVGAEAVGVPLSEEGAARLARFLDLLLTWNKKINLTAITDPLQAIEMHLVDSLAAAPMLAGVSSVLDLGAGGGLPAIPLAVVLPGVRFTLVDAVGKKVGFLKAALPALGLTNARAIHARAEGNPEKEAIPRAQVAISRAFMPVDQWLELATRYVEPGGLALAMLGAETELPAAPVGLRLENCRTYRLPVSGAERRVAAYRVGP